MTNESTTAAASSSGAAGTTNSSSTSSGSSTSGTAAGTTVRIACGQTAAVTDAQGKVWQADTDFTGGSQGVNAGQAVTGTDSPALYDGQRYGNNATPFSYAFSVPAGQYTVLLKFAENFATGAGQRLFDVAVDGTKVLSNFDIYAATGGQWVACDQAFNVTVAAGQSLSVAFSPGSAGNPKVDAIAVLPGANAATTSCSAGSAGTTSGGSGSTSTTSSSSSSSSSGVIPSGVFGVRACGNKLCSTMDDSPVTLIGGVISGCETNFDYARCDAIAAVGENYWATTWKTQHAGTNSVRIHLDACAFMQFDCAPSGSQNIAGDVQQMVKDMTAAGLYVILDEIWSAPDGQQSIGQPGFPDADHSPGFWKALADLYGSQPNVIFDIFNEPFGENVYEDWMAPGGRDIPILAKGGMYSPFLHQDNSNNNAMETASGSYQVEGELQSLALVRGEGATNLALLSSTGWAGEIENWLAIYNTKGNPDPLRNVGASQHAYGYDRGFGPLDAVMDAGYPIVETEFLGANTSEPGASVGNLGTPQQVLAAGVSGLIGCCSHNWGGSGISLVAW